MEKELKKEKNKILKVIIYFKNKIKLTHNKNIIID